MPLSSFPPLLPCSPTPLLPRSPAPLVPLLLPCILLSLSPPPALSQIIPDNTLGAERSQVIENFGGFPIDVITGGAQRSQNLFHSFSEFNVSEDRGALFFSPDDVDHIFSRVTGANPSTILGVLGTAGSDADLFFMNPNGIMFGENASLNVNGSFAAITSDVIQFGEQGEFSATNPQLPGPLLTVDPSAFLFNPGPTGELSVAASTLLVPVEQNLLLLGGPVTINGGQIGALGGRIDIGAVNGPGSVGLTSDGSFSVPPSLNRADITLTNDALVDVALGNGGNITMTGQTISITDGSLVQTGIRNNLGDRNSQAGDIVLDATDTVTLDAGSVVNSIFLNATGAGGDIILTAPALEIANNGILGTDTFGEGDLGDIRIDASDRITLNSGAIFSRVNPTAEGAGGAITINTSILSMLDGAQLVSGTSGNGDTGNIVINANERITLDGPLSGISNSVFAGLIGTVTLEGVGNSGDIEINTTILEILNGATLQSSTAGQGNAGKIRIDASERVTLDGTETATLFEGGIPLLMEEVSSDISSSVVSGSTEGVELQGDGNGGDIQITTSILEVLNGATIQASTSGNGNAGTISIDATERVSIDGLSDSGELLSQISSNVTSDGEGRGGNLNIVTQTLDVANDAQLQTNTRGMGNAGSITLIADTVDVRNGAQLQASTLGQGDAGNITITASDRVTFDGVSSNDGDTSSAALSFVFAGDNDDVNGSGEGNGGNIRITTTTLEVLNGALLNTASLGKGNSGNILINASDRVVFGNSSDNQSTISVAVSGVLLGSLSSNPLINDLTAEGSGEGGILRSPLVP